MVPASSSESDTLMLAVQPPLGLITKLYEPATGSAGRSKPPLGGGKYDVDARVVPSGRYSARAR